MQKKEFTIKNMKTNELRIGNYVVGNYEKGLECDWDYENSELVMDKAVGQVVLLDYVGYTTHSIWIETKDTNVEIFESFEGIILTEDWLKKLGFKENSFSLVWENKRIGVFDCEIFKIANCDIEFLIKYVHQLQNLFYFFEGEELTVSN